MSVAAKLPAPVQQEQVAQHRASQLAPKAPTPDAPPKRRINPHLLKDREDVCKAFHQYAKDRGWSGEGKVPWGTRKPFFAQFNWPKGWKYSQQSWAFNNWWRAWKERDDAAVAACTKSTKRKRRPGGGTHRKCPWLAQALYEWWAHMRYSVNWKRVAGELAEEQRPRKIARYTQDPSSIRPPHLPPSCPLPHLPPPPSRRSFFSPFPRR